MTDHVIHKGDTGTPLSLTLGDREGPWDLTGATITFRYAVNGVTLTKSLEPDPDQVSNKGKASAFWGSTELDAVAPKDYPCQVKVVLSTGRTRFAPSRGFAGLRVRAQL